MGPSYHFVSPVSRKPFWGCCCILPAFTFLKLSLLWLHIWKIIWQGDFFAFSTLEMLFYGLLACLCGTLAIIHTVPLHITCLLSLPAFTSFSSLTLVFSSLTMMHLKVVFFVLMGMLNCLDLWVDMFHQIWEIFSHYFLKYPFSSVPAPHSGVSVTQMLDCVDLSLWYRDYAHYFPTLPLFFWLAHFCHPSSRFFISMLQFSVLPFPYGY